MRAPPLRLSFLQSEGSKSGISCGRDSQARRNALGTMNYYFLKVHVRVHAGGGDEEEDEVEQPARRVPWRHAHCGVLDHSAPAKRQKKKAGAVGQREIVVYAWYRVKG